MGTADGTGRGRGRAGWLWWSLAGALAILLAVGAGRVYWSRVGHRLAPVSQGHLYQSAVMPLADLAEVVQEKSLRSVVDLRTPIEGGPTPASKGELLRTLGVRYFNLPSAQLPDDTTIDRFLALAADADNFPMLIHCYHGDGRSILFAALYRIEFEGWSNEEARRATKLLSFRGAFGPGGDKGRFLREYRCRIRSDPSPRQQS
jgi:predicted protein tyrosine phosphatase